MAKCLKNDCNEMLPQSRFCCKDHWDLLPEELQDELNQTYASGYGYGGPLHGWALTKAFRMLNSPQPERLESSIELTSLTS